MFDGKSILARQERMATGVANINALRAECAHFLLPRQAKFNCLGHYSNLVSPMTEVFDEYAMQKFDEGVSIAMGLSNPRGQIWQRWTLDDDDLMKSQANRLWVEQKNKVLQQLRNDPKSGFTPNMGESWASLLAFGMQSTWLDIRRNIMHQPIGLSYQNEFIGEIYLEENAEGVPHRSHHKFTLTARQAWDKWGDESPEIVKAAMRRLSSAGETEPIEFIHAIYPNHDYDPDRLDHLGKPWRGCFVSVVGEECFKEGGYVALPRIISRFMRGRNGPYGHCPAFQVLPSVKDCDSVLVALMESAEQKSGPTLLAHDDMADKKINYAPREVIQGGLGPRGDERLKPLLNASDNHEAKELLELRHSYIDRAFYANLLQINQDLKSHITDAQIMERKANAGVLLTPLSNQEDEWFSAMLDRELALMDELGLMADMPPAIAEARQAGVGLKVIYDNGVSRAQEASGVGAYFDAERFLAPRFQYDPEALQAWKHKYPPAKLFDYLGHATGIPVAIEASDDERAAAAHADQQAAQSQSLLDAIPNIAKSTRDLSAAIPQQVGGALGA
jgi:hypothetical protein